MLYATARQMQRIDELAINYGLEIDQMMELAGWHMVEVFASLGIPSSEPVTVLVGRGHNGGDGLAAARHLYNHGYHELSIVMAERDLKEETSRQLHIIKEMELPVVWFEEDTPIATSLIQQADIIIDALLGYRLYGAPEEPYATMIHMVNATSAEIIAYDLPSGVDPTTGICHEPCVNALATLCLAAPKKACATATNTGVWGKMYVADLGIPALVYDQVERDGRPPFHGRGVIML